MDLTGRTNVGRTHLMPLPFSVQYRLCRIDPVKVIGLDAGCALGWNLILYHCIFDQYQPLGIGIIAAFEIDLCILVAAIVIIGITHEFLAIVVINMDLR
jgi:hypothetical protein